MERQQKLDVSNSAIFNDLERPLT